MNLDQLSFKDISYLELWQAFCLAELNCLCKIGRRHHRKQFEFGPVAQEEMSFKIFLI